MENSLPEGWIECKLGDVCTKPQYGWTSKASKSGRIKYLRTTDISNGKLDWDTVPYCLDEPGDSLKYQVCKNDILVSRAGSVGFNFRVTKDVAFRAVFASYLIRFRTFDEITARYIDYFLKSESYWKQISGFTAGIAIPNINASKLEELLIPIASLAEQQRIVAKLDELMEKIDRSRAGLERIPKILNRFRQSILSAAVSGKLTEDWRVRHLNEASNDNAYPSSWKENQLGDITTLVTSGSRGWAKYYSKQGSLFIRAQNINSDFLDLEDIAFVNIPNKSEGLRTKIEKYDLLITITGANVTKSALVETNLEDAYVSQHVGLVRLKDVSISKFIYYSIISPDHGRQQLLDSAYGQGKPQLNLDNIKNVVVLVPPKEEATLIVQRVERLFSVADKIEAHYNKAKAQLDKLPQSLLAKAFRGELVPQDENDEPAGVLFDRIMEEKQEKNKPVKMSRAYELADEHSLAAEPTSKYSKGRKESQRKKR